jgi:cytidylate kinase
MGSLGDEIAESLSSRLGWELINRSQLIRRFFANKTDLREQHLLNESPKFYLSTCRSGTTYIESLEKSLYELAANQSAILLGFGSQVIFADDHEALHIRITAPEKVRIARVRKQFRISEEEAASVLDTAEKKHKRFVSTIYGIDLNDTSNYHLSLNTAHLSVDECVSAIMSLQAEHALRVRIEKETTESDSINHQTQLPVFKNSSEAEFARILDMYHIDWKYEPKTFPVEWDAEGNVTCAFSPDFYLTKFDTYLELTTMNQKYVTEKNKKMKKVRELYPGTNVRIVYKRDFLSLVERFHQAGGTE